MSEIKGQLLGVLLVIAVFGAVSAVLFTAFKSSANKVVEKFDPTIQEVSQVAVVSSTDAGSMRF